MVFVSMFYILNCRFLCELLVNDKAEVNINLSYESI